MSRTLISGISPVDQLGQALPYLRRYARALTGSQSAGDGFAAATLEKILADGSALDGALSPRIGLFRLFHHLWSRAGAPTSEPDTEQSAAAQRHMSRLTPLSREALLLQSVENFSSQEIGQVLGIHPDEADALVGTAQDEMRHALTGRVIIIEDESIIALDLAGLVAELGLEVAGVARTRKDAVALAAREQPDLVLADIQLADRSSGIDAVDDILNAMGSRPVIFVTAFPEKLLTGEKPEPAFLIAKPFSEDEVRSAVSQAMFFAPTLAQT